MAHVGSPRKTLASHMSSSSTLEEFPHSAGPISSDLMLVQEENSRTPVDFEYSRKTAALKVFFAQRKFSQNQCLRALLKWRQVNLWISDACKRSAKALENQFSSAKSFQSLNRRSSAPSVKLSSVVNVTVSQGENIVGTCKPSELPRRKSIIAPAIHDFSSSSYIRSLSTKRKSFLVKTLDPNVDKGGQNEIVSFLRTLGASPLEKEKAPKEMDVKKKWKSAVKKIIEKQRREKLFKSDELHDLDSSMDNKDLYVLPNRLVDYFVVFGVYPPESLFEADFDALTVKQVENILSTADIFAGIMDRYPSVDCKNSPLEDSWTNFAFPTGISLSWTKRAARYHFSVLTNSQGVNSYATFLQFDQPLSPLLRRKTRHGIHERPHNHSALKHSRKELYAPRAISLVSHYPIFPEMKKMLSQVYFAAIERDLDSKIPIEFLIRRIAREIPLPIPGKAGIEFSLIDHDDPISISMHPLRHPLCSRFHFSFLFDSLSIDTVLGIFSSIVSEKRIIFHSSSLSRLTIISQCITQLLYPFKLSTIFIPVVPEQMIDIYQIPQPYLIGVHSKFLPQLFDLHGIVIVDLDHDIVRSTVELPRLPEEHGALLWQNLFDVLEMHIENNDVVSETSNDPFESENELLRQFDSQICEAFLIFYSSILNGYRKHLLFIDSVPVFNRNGFLLSKLNGDSGIDEFLNQFVQTRMFERFLQEDLDVEELQKDLYREFIASDAFEVLNEIRAIESRITKLYNLPKIECLSERDPEFEKFVETMSSSPFCNSLCKEFLEPTKKFKLKYVTDKKYKAFSRPRHFENDLNEHPGCLQLKLYLQSLFLEEEIGIDQRTEVEFSMRESEVRSCLGSILKQNTQKNSMIRLCKGSFEAFSRLLQICLHFSNNIDDFKCAYHILKASGSFYCDTFKSNGLMKRHFLSELIRDCNFWKKISFWDFVFENQLKETSNASSNSRDAETIDLKGDEFVVSSLMESAHWMIQFGMDSKCVEHQIFVIARRYKVSSQDLMTIKQLVHNISRVQT